MRPRVLALALLLWPGGCGGAAGIPETDLLLRIETQGEDVAFGRAFPLAVVRVWDRELVPADWDDEDLSPLVLRLVETSRREDQRRVEETRRYRAYLFERGTVRLPPVTFTARAPGEALRKAATSAALVLRVASSLEEAAPGPVEYPEGPLAWPSSSLPWVIGISLAVAGLALVGLRLRRPAGRALVSPAIAPGPTRSPRERALARILGLRDCCPAGHAEIQAYYVEASGLVRDFIEETLAVRAPEMTTEEFLASAQAREALDGERRGMLADFLAHCDQVKFARLAPGPADCGRMLQAAELFVTETRPGERA